MNNDMNELERRSGTDASAESEKNAPNEFRAATDISQDSETASDSFRAYDAAQDRMTSGSERGASNEFRPAQDVPERARDDRALGFDAPRERPGSYDDRPRDFDAPRERPQSYGDVGASGEYRMAHPDNSTTYFNPGQGEPSRRAEWSNSDPSFSGGRGAYGYDGDYRAPRGDSYRPNVNPYSAQRPYPYERAERDFAPAGDVPSSKKDKTEKTKKEKKGASAGVVAVICAACVTLSGVCGFFGARLATTGSLTGDAAPSGKSAPGTVSEDRSTVIYRSVATDSDTKESSSVSDVVDAVADSVVEITTEFRSTGYWQFIQSGAGSGVIISEDGYIATNNHVIMNNGSLADAIKVRLRDGTTYEAKVIGRDSDADIAVIKIEAEGDLTASVFGDSSTLVVGQDIVAIGNPLGELGGTVTEGIVSALDREVDVEGTKMNLLQISAAINPGNSGGGLFNMKGELVGIVNAKSSGSGIEGLGFAIPSNDASHIVEELITNGYVTGKPFLGITTYYCEDAFTAYRYFGSQATGLYIYETLKGYNENVLKQGDRIIEANGTEIVTRDDLVTVLKECTVGDTIKLVVYREGKRTEVDVKVYEYVPSEDEVAFES